MLEWIYISFDGSEWIMRSHSLDAARLGAHKAELARTGSTAAAFIARESVKPYRVAS